jgi:hypothetical protein
VGKKGKVAVYLTPRQIAAAEEAADHYAMFVLEQGSAVQRRTTQSAADNLRQAFVDTKELWPW